MPDELFLIPGHFQNKAKKQQFVKLLCSVKIESIVDNLICI